MLISVDAQKAFDTVNWQFFLIKPWLAINVEPLAALIRKNDSIKGIKDQGQIEHNISLYADDVLTYISDPATSVPALMRNLKEYGELSKSEAVKLVGHWPAQLTGSVKFHWSNQGFRYLGIIITPAVQSQP